MIFDVILNSLTEPKPKNEIEILVNSNDGVVHKVVFDYFDYQIIGSLEEYNYLDKPNC